MNDLTWQVGCIVAIILVMGGLSCIVLWTHRVRQLYREPKIKLNPMLQRDWSVGRDVK